MVRQFKSIIGWLFYIWLFQTTAFGQFGLIVNEVSNGASGAQEYFELVVVDEGAGGCTADIRGFILDDNNGDFSCGPRTGAGIAQGHIRFSTSGPWGAIPYGAILVVYNDGDPNPALPPDDPTDLNGDSVYVIGSSHPDIEVSAGSGGCTGTDIPVGCGSTCPGTGNSGYAGAPYSFGGSWLGIGLRNSGGDAAQVRAPSGAYFHGISYGSSNITGGPDGLNISTSSGSGKVYYFNDGDYRAVANYTEGTAGTAEETPGAYNNAANRAFITGIRCAILPVEFASPLTAVGSDEIIRLEWATAQETDHQLFEIERAANAAGPFEKIGEIPGAANSHSFKQYNFSDFHPLQGDNFYRLKLIDREGKFTWSNVVSARQQDLLQEQARIFPNPAENVVSIDNFSDSELIFELFDLTGKTIATRRLAPGTLRLQTQPFERGLYLYRIHSESGFQQGKLILR